ncbi:SPFH domain containing protein [Pandoravirus neocaledonia]|uniref:SPFH domain containing protein n=1 Tax=Pandoravirus neocaledonia TaxID=2107708 RepID=A0A2U7UBA0_9VIRU|nr:SPFH domain containing protein [Pandoravirus neocaledonia]AVK75696.1 SPFH domain containing protein [Pandoravirus neocaledonia]
MKVIRRSTVGIKETWGKFSGVLPAGLHFYVPLVSRVTVVPTWTVTQAYSMGVKTSDNVFCDVSLSIGYRVADPERAFYEIADHEALVDAQVEDSLRGVAPRFALDALFAAKDEIQDQVGERLKGALARYGVAVDSVMVTSIEPDREVRKAMNDINAAARQRMAALDRAEADKLRIVKEAEAEADRKRLQGEGIAAMRKAMLSGYEEGITGLAQSLGLSAQEAMVATMVTQYIDAMEKLAVSHNAKTILYSSDAAGSVTQLGSQFGALFANATATTPSASPSNSPKTTPGRQ